MLAVSNPLFHTTKQGLQVCPHVSGALFAVSLLFVFFGNCKAREAWKGSRLKPSDRLVCLAVWQQAVSCLTFSSLEKVPREEIWVAGSFWWAMMWFEMSLWRKQFKEWFKGFEVLGGRLGTGRTICPGSAHLHGGCREGKGCIAGNQFPSGGKGGELGVGDAMAGEGCRTWAHPAGHRGDSCCGV